ncbi:hypothetical protein GO730_26790 [Spirosoma sp. HMF3257]|uniref:VCBS repeat-containing protein n=1 Tax=Spirosoma telluris TaxID=2183553 RepID=A0A327NVK5_9BACT|nr:hypothetical protein [Spirosoma telluris]RAI76868.1 hypothetical protein HMF3257_26715 [Spirosoma telluris]
MVEPLQGLMRDFDNDGFVDVLLTGDMPGQLWRNNGNKTFTLQTGRWAPSRQPPLPWAI